jgi:CBS domain-containing protein
MMIDSGGKEKEVDAGPGFTCPDCEHTIRGSNDTCPECRVNLNEVAWPIARDDMFDVSLITETLSSLHPRPPIIVPPDITVADAVRQLCDRQVGCVLIGEHDSIVGIFSERDAMLRVADRYDTASSAPLAEFMTPLPEMMDIDTPIALALNLMATREFRHIPVTRNGRLIGMVSVRDLLDFLEERYPNLLTFE